VLQRVVDQVVEDALDQAEVGIDERQSFVRDSREIDALLPGRERELLDHVARQLGQGERLAREGSGLVVEASELAQLVDQAAQVLALAERHRDVALPLLALQLLAALASSSR
jgi:hypothetical protein